MPMCKLWQTIWRRLFGSSKRGSYNLNEQKWPSFDGEFEDVEKFGTICQKVKIRKISRSKQKIKQI
jgi:hypothetical protein